MVRVSVVLVSVCVKSQTTEAWTPAIISKRGGLLLANRKIVLSVSMWAYSCRPVGACAIPWKVSVGVRESWATDFCCLFSAAYFQLSHFNGPNEERREEREEERKRWRAQREASPSIYRLVWPENKKTKIWKLQDCVRILSGKAPVRNFLLT